MPAECLHAFMGRRYGGRPFVFSGPSWIVPLSPPTTSILSPSTLADIHTSAPTTSRGRSLNPGQGSSASTNRLLTRRLSMPTRHLGIHQAARHVWPTIHQRGTFYKPAPAGCESIAHVFKHCQGSMATPAVTSTPSVFDGCRSATQWAHPKRTGQEV